MYFHYNILTLQTHLRFSDYSGDFKFANNSEYDLIQVRMLEHILTYTIQTVLLSKCVMQILFIMREEKN